MNTSVALIIPVLNEEKTLKSFLYSIQNQNILPNEIIFVDAGSKDNTIKIIKKWIQQKKIYPTQVKLLLSEGAFPGKGRNIGVKYSKAKWVAFLDCGIIPKKDWLENFFRDYSTV